MAPTLLTTQAETRLVAKEALAAFARKGWTVAEQAAKNITRQSVDRLFSLPPQRSGLGQHPSLFFSVNFHGLDKYGEIFARLQAYGLPVAVWVVDNPWNLLAGMRNDFWKNTRLFVTDPSFIPGLREKGARYVAHLPLGTDPTLFCPQPGSPVPPAAANLQPLVFVGRSSFPDKDRFFVGQSIDESLLDEARACALRGERPDYFWWLARPELNGAARKAALGAEETSAFWRLACLRAALPEGLTLFGDAGWQGLLPTDQPGGPDLRVPVDYYGSLPAVYRCADFSLAMTSFLLPHGLNQRHFDVWAAGGFCLTDATPGLDLFPPELTRPVTFARPEEIGELVHRFRADPAGKAELTRQWRDHILSNHCCEHRIATLLQTIFA